MSEDAEPKGPMGWCGTDLSAIELPRVVGLSWTPTRPLKRMTYPEAKFLGECGVVVVFNKEIDPVTLDLMSCAVQWRQEFPVKGFAKGAYYHWLDVATKVTPVGLPTEIVKCGMDLIEDFAKYAEAGEWPVNAVQLTFPKHPEGLPPGIYRVVLSGDMILSRDDFMRLDGTKGQLALDGNHLAPGLPNRCPTGDLIEGGRFEAWFMLRPLKKSDLPE